MSEKRLRGRIPVSRRIKPPHPSPSTHRLRRRVVIGRRSSSKKPLKFISRCKSEPALLTVDVGGATEDHGGLISISRSRPDIFSSAPELVLPYSPSKIQRDPKELQMEQYNKDAKVVVNVTVEGCPGAIRAMVRLGSTVEETMKIVKHKYESEGRCPRLDQSSISTFELHPSHFSLRCLDKSDMIGNFGSRSFYMRKRSNENPIVGSEIISTRPNGSPPSSLDKSGMIGNFGSRSFYMRKRSNENPVMGSEVISTRPNGSPPPSPTIIYPNFMCQNFKKVIRLLGSPPPSPTIIYPNFMCQNFKKVIRLLGKLLGCLDG